MINQTKLKNLMNDSDWFSVGIDYLQINLKKAIPFLSETLHRLDTDNSNIFFDNIGELQLSMTKNYSKRWMILDISISIENIPYPMFQYMEYSEKQKQILKSTWKFVYYWTYFRLIEIWKLNQFFEEKFFSDYYDTFRWESISRIDYRIDLFYEKETAVVKTEEVLDTRTNVKNRNHNLTEDAYMKKAELLKHLSKVQNNKPLHYDIQSLFAKWMNSTGRDYGSKSNKSLYFRMYDKLLDSIIKWKMMLYDDYFGYESVHRFEIEFRIKFNKKKLPNGRMESYKLSELWDLEEKIHRYLWLTEWDINEKFIYQYNNNETTDFSEKSRYQKDFWWRWYVIALEGFNPFISLHKILNKKNLNGKLFKKLVYEYLDFISEKRFLDGLWIKIWGNS